MENIKKVCFRDKFFYAAASTFLCGNLWFRLENIWHYSAITKTICVLSILFCVIIILWPRYFKVLLIIFGASFCLYGFHSYSIYNKIFEFLVTVVSMAILVMSLRGGQFKQKNVNLTLLLFLYILLSLFSLLTLPLNNLLSILSLWGPSGLAHQAFSAVPESYFYPIAGVNRLILFFVFVLLLSALVEAKRFYTGLFTGILLGAVLAVITGLLDYYGVISLQWFRAFNLEVNPADIQFRLQSTFGHSGWFAEYVIVAIPFILLGYFRKNNTLPWKISLLVILVLCEIALILAKARAGWISYPLTLALCWIFFYLFKKNENMASFSLTKTGLLKVALSIPITIGISLFVVFWLLGASSVSIESTKGNRQMSKRFQDRLVNETIAVRAAQIFRASDRTLLWIQGIDVGRERPFFGMGFESYRWHDRLLMNIPDSYLTKNQSHKLERDTPHSLFVQLFVSGGIVGLMLWCAIMGYSCILLFRDLQKNKNYLNICVILSMVSFHMYGVFQSMQYIPMVWMLIFLCFGYVMTIKEDVLGFRTERFFKVSVKVFCILVAIGFFVYLFDSSSKSLAQKYGMKVYGKDLERESYAGFYGRERWGDKYYRWTGRRAIARVVDSGFVKMVFQCSTPGVERYPVVLKVSLDGEPIDEIEFRKKGREKRAYLIEKGANGDSHAFLFDVSRTWNPKQMGLSEDTRNLGVAVSEFTFIRKLPVEAVKGF